MASKDESTYSIGIRDKPVSTAMICNDTDITKIIGMVDRKRQENASSGELQTSREIFKFMQWEGGGKAKMFEGTLTYSLTSIKVMGGTKLYLNHLEGAQEITQTSRSDFNVEEWENSVEDTDYDYEEF